MKNSENIIKELLSIDHHNMAVKLQLINEKPKEISQKLMYECVSLLDELSIRSKTVDKRIIITISALLWTYRNEKWHRLKGFLITVLSRSGFAPSSIMLEDTYHEHQSFDTDLNLLEKLAIAIHQYNHEVVVSDKIYMLTAFQYAIWQQINKAKITGISAPTSAGKSFIIALKTIQLLKEKGGIVVYVVPTLSLVNQVSTDYKKLIGEHELKGYEILNTYISDKEGANEHKIYVLTQEKAIAAFTQKDNPYGNLRLIVIDEIQNVERVASEDDQRAKTLFDLLIEFRQNCEPDYIIISGPRIEKISEFGTEVFGEVASGMEADSSPVCSITYSLKNGENKAYFKQYSVLSDKPNIIEIAKELAMPKGAFYNEKIHEYISKFIVCMGQASKNILFSPKSEQAVTTAKYLAANFTKTNNDPRIISLVEYLKDTVHTNYDLSNVIESGVAYHHGKMPLHARRVIERAINEKLIDNVVCTTTLMQGVNLPAQNVIIRNPHLFVKRTKQSQAKLTDYEIANLRGRAGRLMKDFLGRTFILEEENFETGPDDQLFTEAKKELASGYDLTFQKHKKDIISDLKNSVPIGANNQEYSFLTTYIRQATLKHGQKVNFKLADVKIELNDEEVNSIIESLDGLKIPKQICLKNRYWDPFVLNELYLAQDEFFLPSSLEDNIAVMLKRLVELLHAKIPFYASRYFDIKDVPNRQALTQACICADQWAHEKTLKVILSSPYYNNPENINKVINLLQNKVSYGLPMLLQPLYDIKLPESSFLRFIELGAYHPITRKLIEYNVPRETAIYLKNNVLQNINTSKSGYETEILAQIISNQNNLDYWVKVQLESIL